MKRLLIVAHAPSENTRALRDAVERGARSETGIDVHVVAPLQSGPDDVLAAQAVILGTTENLGYMSGALKHAFDVCYYPCLDATQGRPFGLYVHGNSDVSGAVRAIDGITKGLGWARVAEHVLVTATPSKDDLQACWELGATVAAGLMA